MLPYRVIKLHYWLVQLAVLSQTCSCFYFGIVTKPPFKKPQWVRATTGLVRLCVCMATVNVFTFTSVFSRYRPPMCRGHPVVREFSCFCPLHGVPKKDQASNFCSELYGMFILPTLFIWSFTWKLFGLNVLEDFSPLMEQFLGISSLFLIDLQE